MFIFYDIIFLIFSLAYLLVYLFKGKFHKGFSARLGVVPKEIKFNRPIWIHAVSVGEVAAVKGLLAALRKDFPNKEFVLSTVTPTGNQIARTIAEKKDFVTYLPLDFSFIVRAVLNRINPEIFVIAETEIWPNLISFLYNKKIPIVVVNGRISDRSLKGYCAIKFLLKPVLNKINFFCVQSKLDAERLIALGVLKEKIKVTGNMKFDASLPRGSSLSEVGEIKKILGLESGGKLFIAASTHPGEEEIILGAYKTLLKEFPQLKLLIAPRHPQRSKEVADQLRAHAFNPVLLSTVAIETKENFEQAVFILDMVGQLVTFYAAADVVFVGGSLVKKGGHNILEPAGLGKPVIFGPQMFNFRDISELFLKNNGAILVHSQEELAAEIKYLLSHPAKIQEMSQLAQKIISENQGATEKNIQVIRSLV
ncbi:MAG: 3-deoxy-D-manno-octulosonic acid transferase [Candidatus Omnitrophica bacterium]|nr:3-deoxy-D-manno-octulosonic acid transferase [Candidatus Omnitrophota bacterium]